MATSPEPMDISDTERKISMQACNVLNELRKNGQLCDAVIVVEDGNFPVHRAIMSACSPYFRALFTNGMNETDQREVYIPGVTADMMSLIVDYAYTRDVTICSSNVERLVQAADQFHVLGLVKACTNFLVTQLEPENCIGIRSFARLFFCSNLERVATHYIMENFPEIASKSNEILNLTQSELIEILESDDLNVKNEETVFDCMVRWIKHDEAARKPQTYGILKTIRLGLLSTQYFVETVKNHQYIKENEECRPLVIDTLKFLYDLDMEDKEVDITHPLARPRIPHEVMFVVGGWSSGSPTNAIETYDTRADRWILIEQPDRGVKTQREDKIRNKRHTRQPAALLERYVFNLHLKDDREMAFQMSSENSFHTAGVSCNAVANMRYLTALNSCRTCFSYDKDKWIAATDYWPRAYHGCATVGQKVYVIGGFDGMDYFNSCRCLDSVKKQWCEVAPMNARRCYVSVAVLDGCIYAMGGYDGQVRQNTAERYTPKHNQWSLVTPMNHQRSDASAATCEGKVYICGGFNGQECLNTSEYYDPQTNQWTMVAPMRNRRSGVSVICHAAQVYAIGGFNGVTRMNNGERYSPSTNTWTNISEMYSPRSNFGIEVIDDMIFAIGGFNGVNTIANVECYDPSVEEWYDCTDMNINRSALSACVVKGLPNVRDYIHKDRSKVEDKKKRSSAAVAAATAANPRIAAANAIVQAAARNAAAQNAANNAQNNAVQQQNQRQNQAAQTAQPNHRHAAHNHQPDHQQQENNPFMHIMQDDQDNEEEEDEVPENDQPHAPPQLLPHNAPPQGPAQADHQAQTDQQPEQQAVQHADFNTQQ